MDFWIACLLLLAAIAGIVFLAVHMKGKDRKAGYIVGIVALVFLAFAALGYLGLTLLLLGGIA